MPRNQFALFPALPEDYTAFKVVDLKQDCLNVRRACGQWEWLPYHYRLRISGNSPAWSCVMVAYTFLTLRLTGRNLQEVADAIAARRCDFIEEYDAEHWLQPKDASAPFIERVEVIAGRSPDQVFAAMDAGAEE